MRCKRCSAFLAGTESVPLRGASVTDSQEQYKILHLTSLFLIFAALRLRYILIYIL